MAAMYGFHHDPGYAERLRAEGYLPEMPTLNITIPSMETVT